MYKIFLQHLSHGMGSQGPRKGHTQIIRQMTFI